MNNSRHFLIISLIVHLLVFIILASIVLPPPRTRGFREFLDSLYLAEFMEVQPIRRIKKEIPPRIEVKQEEKLEASQDTKPPELEVFPLLLEETLSNPIRVASSEKTVTLKASPTGRKMTSVQPTALKPISRPIDDEDTVMPPSSDQDGRSIADANGKVSFSVPAVGPVGSRPGVKGQGERYIYPFYSGATSQQRGGVDEFAKILPELARGILEQATQKKMDIVFVIDTTGSMRDNVRGVKDYIHHFLEPLEEQEFDAGLGLVEFTDLEVTEAKVVGLTQSQKKFRKWLDRVTFFGGRDIPESGYEALIAALERVDFRDDTQKFFIFISDAPQHDFDYDGKSIYSLDRIIARLNDEGVRVDVVGADCLSMKQLAWGTGGQWKHIPGGDPFTDVPHPTSSMIRSGLDRSLLPVLVEDKVTVEFESSTPDWVDLSYKMLDPRGFKCLGTLTYRKKIYHKEEKRVEFSPKIDLSRFGDHPGTYTLIYRIRDSIGNRDVLRRTLELRGK